MHWVGAYLCVRVCVCARVRAHLRFHIERMAWSRGLWMVYGCNHEGYSHYEGIKLNLLNYGAQEKADSLTIVSGRRFSFMSMFTFDKPGKITADFTKEFAEEGAILIGNSIGSLTALTAAATGGADLFRFVNIHFLQAVMKRSNR